MRQLRVNDVAAFGVALVLHRAEAGERIETHHSTVAGNQALLSSLDVVGVLLAELKQLHVGQLQLVVVLGDFLLDRRLGHPHDLLDILPVVLKPRGHLAVVVRDIHRGNPVAVRVLVDALVNFVE